MVINYLDYLAKLINMKGNKKSIDKLKEWYVNGLHNIENYK